MKPETQNRIFKAVVIMCLSAVNIALAWEHYHVILTLGIFFQGLSCLQATD